MSINEQTITREMKSLIKERANIKRQVTRLLNKVKSTTDMDIGQLENRKEKITSLNKAFFEVQIKIECLDEDTDYEIEKQEFEDSVDECEDIIDSMINKLTNSRSSSIQRSTYESPIPGTAPNAQSILPKIHIKPFDGNLAEWHSFHDTFLSLVHENVSIPTVHKFHLLKSYLIGNASSAIASLNASEENYQTAWNLIQKRFNKPRRIIITHISALFELTSVTKDSPSSLRVLAERAEMHVNALKALGEPVEWDEMLIYIVTSKLDKQTRLAWERSIDEDKPTFKDLIKCLYKYSQEVEPIQLLTTDRDRSNKTQNNQMNRQTYGKVQNSTHRVLVSNTQSNTTCPICKQEHSIHQCSILLKKSPRERWGTIRSLNLCLNCLRGNHQIAQCKAGNCRKCDKKHNTLLHFEDSKPHSSETTPSTSALPSTAGYHSSRLSTSPEILLSTAKIKIIDRNNKEHYCRALLDSGAQSNFITERLAQRLQLTRQSNNQVASGLGQQVLRIRYAVKTSFKSCDNQFQSEEITFLTMPSITGNLPTRKIDRSKLAIPANVRLADPEFNVPAEIDILLGEYLFYRLLGQKQINLQNNTTILQQTKLGWVISGRVDNEAIRDHQSHCYFSATNLNDQLPKFWDLEPEPHTRHLSPEEEACENYFSKTTFRLTCGRYVVRLPFKENKSAMGNSYNAAIRRFYSLENKLERNPKLHSEYSKFMKEYVELGHMTDVTNSSNSQDGFYLPHHAVLKELSLTTKIRVVFDGSMSTDTGTSLNDTLMVGPTLQDDLFDILTRFRLHSYVITADIEKMYRQIMIHPEDRKYQKILWRESKQESLKTFSLNTVTYGTSSAPFLAIRTLQQLARDEQHKYPLAANAIIKDFYVDDLLTGASTFEEAQTLHTQLIKLTKLGGFNLRQWVSNEPKLINNSREQPESEKFYLDPLDTKKTLGIFWNPFNDAISYTVNPPTDQQQLSKRVILSKTAQLFDPLGLLGPVVTRAKILIQTLWKLNLGWDEMVPHNIQLLWQELRSGLINLQQFSIPREILIKNAVNVQLHGFCDASERAFGACIYFRSTDNNGKTIVRLVCAKSRVAPVKPTTIPRLELCAAVLLTKLYKKVSTALGSRDYKIYLWSDATIVLHWISAAPHTLKTFVANRVAEIQSHTKPQLWHHVPTNENPADALSRGQLPNEFLNNKSWLGGPAWLSMEEHCWPQGHVSPNKSQIPELRITTSLVTSNGSNEILNRFSSLDTLQRVIAYCLRFTNNSVHNRKKLHGALSLTELQAAHTRIIKLLQQQEFAFELNSLRKGKPLEKQSHLANLTPFIDRDDIIRVGGRLRNANITFNQKHPIVLPRNHHITKLIIQFEHTRNMHAGILATLNAVRQRYWPIDGKNTTRYIVRKCIQCFRAKPQSSPNYIMGNLPQNRIVASRPFENVGIDYCGPFFVKEKKFRNTKRLKVYVAVFICFSTKAVHLEVVSDMTTEAFLASLRRFFARRGFSKNIYSDNGSNFIGANNQIQELQALIQTDKHNEIIQRELTRKHIQWHFSPARSPHFGGLWEAAVRSFKSHMSKTIGDSLFTYEQLNTFVIEIEAILNSRPLTPLSSDPNDLQALTPAHFLIGEPLMSLPECDFANTPSNRLSNWQHIQRVKQHFWNRWHKEYINQLNIHTKWYRKCNETIEIGTLVLLKDDNLPPLEWSLGRITAIHPGSDKITRVVTVRTSSGIYKRTIAKICPLPIYDQDTDRNN